MQGKQEDESMRDRKSVAPFQGKTQKGGKDGLGAGEAIIENVKHTSQKGGNDKKRPP